jgi:hypothetical protein
MKPLRLVTVLLTAVLAACAAPADPTLTPTTAPSATSSPTVEALVAGTATHSPLTMETPAIVIESGDRPSPTPLRDVPLPLEQLAILLPGPGSQVVSPIYVLGRGGPTWNQRVSVRLLGEEGQELARTSTFLWAPAQASGRFAVDLPFRIDGVAEAARLEVTADDMRYRRMAQLTTVDLVLLSIGTPRIHPAFDGPEKLAILSPREGAVASGGRVTVRGAGWVDADVPLRIEVLDRSGSVVGSAEAHLDSPIGQLGSFSVEIPFSVAEPQFGRIALSEVAADIPGLVHYSSVEVYLEP